MIKISFFSFFELIVKQGDLSKISSFEKLKFKVFEASVRYLIITFSS